MHAVKNGIKCAARTPVKTALFTLLLAAASALLCVSVSVFAAVRAYLNDCESYFHTIARLEYVGRDYPDESVFDPAAAEAVGSHRADIEALVASDGAISFSPSDTYLAYSPGVVIRDESIIDPDAAVLKLNVIAYDEHAGVFTASVAECLYSRKALTDKIISFRTDGRPSGAVFAAGHFLRSSGFTPIFEPERIVFRDGGSETELPPFASADDAEHAAAYERYARLLRVKNDSCRAYYTACLEDEPLFHQQLVTLAEGRTFTEEEYSFRARSAVISERFARLAGLGLGSRIHLDIYGSDGDVYDTANDFIADSGDYEVVGVFREGDSFPWTVFLPDAGAFSAAPVPANGYTVGVFRLENSSVSEFLNAAAPLLKSGFRVTVFDQGYSAAAEPIKELAFISAVFLSVSAALAAAALALQSCLFVSRQREAALIMRDLGCGKAHVFVYYLSSALLVSVLAAAAGCFICRLAEGAVLGALKRFAEQFAGEDTTFSDSRLAAIRTLVFDPVIPVSSYLLAALPFVSASLLSTAVFTAFALKKPGRKRGKRSVKKREGRTSRLSGFFKYGALSARRSVFRSLAVIVLCAAAGLFFQRAVRSVRGYEEQLDAYKDAARITGYAADSAGSRIDGVIVRGTAVERLIRSGEIDEFSVTDDIGHVRPLGVTVSADGAEHKVPYSLPASGNELEIQFERIEKYARWSVCSSLEEAPIFHFTGARNIEWLDGFDDRIFLGSSNACAMPLDMMEENGIKLGDTVRFEYAGYLEKNGLMFCYVNELKVVAGYSSAQNAGTVCCPIGYRPPHDDMGWTLLLPLKAFGQTVGYTFIEEYTSGFDITSVIPRFYSEPSMDEVGAYSRFDPEAFLNGKVDLDKNFRSFIFASHDAERLGELRKALAEGFDFVGSPGRSKGRAVIEDEIYLSTVRSMTRQIQYVSAFSYALFALTGVSGGVLAWLLVQSRRREIAVMRALGTPKIKILLNFLAEQAALCIAGLCLGVLFSHLTGAPVTALSAALCFSFFMLWSLSALVCLAVSLLKRSYAALTEPE